MGFAQNKRQKNTNRQLWQSSWTSAGWYASPLESFVLGYSSTLQNVTMIALSSQSFFSSLCDCPFFCWVAACFSPFPEATHNYPQQGVKIEQQARRAKLLLEKYVGRWLRTSEVTRYLGKQLKLEENNKNGWYAIIGGKETIRQRTCSKV